MASSPSAVRPRSSPSRVSRRLGGARPGWGVLVLPLLVFLVVVFAIPVWEALRRSLTEFSAPQVGGLDNYRWFFETPVNLRVLWRTIRTALLVTGVTLALAYPYAYLMTLVRSRWRLLMIGIVLLPFWTSLLVRTYAWVVLLQDGGVVNDALGVVGIGPLKLIDHVSGVTIGMVQILLPFMVLPLFATMQRIDRRLLLAAEGLGATPLAALLRVYLPLSAPGVLAGCLLVFVLSLGFYVTPALLGSPEQSLLSQLIVSQIDQVLAFGRAGVMAAVLLALTLLIVAVAARATRSLTARGARGAHQ